MLLLLRTIPRNSRSILLKPPRALSCVRIAFNPGAPIRQTSTTSTSYSQTHENSLDDATMPKEKLSFQLKTPKGTKDWYGPDILLRDQVFNTITSVFRAHGALALDTPVFELREILAGKYGEDSKLIYDLQDQGGEICSLRYDLTVPFARWLAMNTDIKNVKRYHIAKVYRRDQPAMTKGRMREFYQCDFDIAGAGWDTMVPDAEVLRIASEVFDKLGWKGTYTIKMNHRKILDGVFKVCGVPEPKIRSISSAVDKLDKLPWSDVCKEMVEEKGLDGEVADKIETYVCRKGGRELLEQLQADETLTADDSARTGLEEMTLLMDYLSAFGVLSNCSFDMSLARGLDYYTGIIYEVVTEGSAPHPPPEVPSFESKSKSSSRRKHKEQEDDDSENPSVGVGSVAAGGRYDNLVRMFNPRGELPCVGISFGVDRIISITKSRLSSSASPALRSSETQVYVMAFGFGKTFTGFLKERMEVCKTLWDAGIKAEFLYKAKPKLPAQFKAAETTGAPFAVILGEDELKNGQIKIKEMGLDEGHPEKDGVLIKMEDLVGEVKARLVGKEGTGVVEGLGGLSLNLGEKEEMPV